MIPIFELSSSSFVNASYLLRLQSALSKLVLFHEVSRSAVHHFKVESRVKVVLNTLVIVLVILNHLIPIDRFPYHFICNCLVLKIRQICKLCRYEVLVLILCCLDGSG